MQCRSDKTPSRHFTGCLVALLLSLLPVICHADCANPTAAESKVMYNSTYHILQFCNGTNWIAAGAAARSPKPIRRSARSPTAASARLTARR